MYDLGQWTGTSSGSIPRNYVSPMGFSLRWSSCRRDCLRQRAKSSQPGKRLTPAAISHGTTLKCGKWHTAKPGDICAKICAFQSIPSKLFLEANPSLSQSNCDQSLRVGVAYCVGPTVSWNIAIEGIPPMTTPVYYTTYTAKPTP